MFKRISAFSSLSSHTLTPHIYINQVVDALTMVTGICDTSNSGGFRSGKRSWGSWVIALTISTTEEANMLIEKFKSPQQASAATLVELPPEKSYVSLS